MPISRGSEQRPLGSILMAPLIASEPIQACDCPRVPEVRPLIVTDPDCSQEACFGCGRVPDCGAFECLPFQAMQFRLKPALARLAHSDQRFIQQVDGFVGATGCAAQPSHHTKIAMTGCAERASRAAKDLDSEEAERLLLYRYTGLPLLPAGEDGGRCAVLARFGCCEVRLTEFPPDSMPFLPLWVELYRESVRVLVDACGFSELEDAVEAVQELVEKAKRLHDGT